MDFKYTTALDKIRRMTARKKVIQGGSSAGKTFSIIPILIDKAIATPLIDITVIAQSIPHLKGGAMKDFLKIMKMTKRFIRANWNDTNRKYIFTNGSSIEFANADGDKAIGPRRNILYINEANLISYSIYNQLAIRTDGDIYLDFNPTNRFWVHNEVLLEADSELLIINYVDNEALGETIITELESKRDKGFNPDGSIKNEYWANWWQVYGLGEVGKLEGVIFNNWSEIDSIPEEASIIATGIDWGFTNDVTAIVNVYKWNGKLLLDEICYQTKLLNKAISDIIKDNDINWEIYADCAEPKSIEELKQAGHWIRPATKGPDSIIYGLSILQEYDILITKRSKNLKDELLRYTWMVDRDGKSLNKPIDAFNHCFIANTDITTNKGTKKIIDIEEGDMVLTQKGFNKVIKKFNNGIKYVNEYIIVTTNRNNNITCTDNHKIKTDKGWKEIKDIQKTDILYLNVESKIYKEEVVTINVKKSYKEEVYDIMVENEHEYFANDILVHNCIDAIRYVAIMKLKKEDDSPMMCFNF